MPSSQFALVFLLNLSSISILNQIIDNGFQASNIKQLFEKDQTFVLVFGFFFLKKKGFSYCFLLPLVVYPIFFYTKRQFNDHYIYISLRLCVTFKYIAYITCIVFRLMANFNTHAFCSLSSISCSDQFYLLQVICDTQIL